ncbi:MAG: T9SS type A sorting domain-containing protein, partial [Bacteroidota bacterium]
TPIDYIELRRANVSDRKSTSGSQGYFVLGRDWFVKTIDDAALTANVSIRFYFDPNDSTTFSTEASAFSSDEGGTLGSVTWFKVDNSWEGTDIDPGTGLSGLAGYTTLSPASYGEESGLHYVQFDNLSSFSGGGAIVPVTGTLPVELLSFQGKQINREILLSWATATEVNSESFELERFSDSTFVSIGVVKAAGISSEIMAYEFIDRDIPPSRHSLVYRLKQIDIDGSFTYSNSIEVALLENLWNNGLKIFPNPATDQLTITYEAINQGVVNLEIFDLNGRRVIQKKQKPTSQPSTYSLDVSQLEVGFYLLSVEQEGNQQRVLFQVQN